MPDNELPLHERLHALVACGLTQVAIAEAIGFAQPTVSTHMKTPRPGMKLRTSERFMSGVRKLEAQHARALAQYWLAQQQIAAAA